MKDGLHPTIQEPVCAMDRSAPRAGSGRVPMGRHVPADTVMYRRVPAGTGGYRQKFTAGRYRRQPTKNPIWMAAFSVGMRLNPPLA